MEKLGIEEINILDEVSNNLKNQLPPEKSGDLSFPLFNV